MKNETCPGCGARIRQLLGGHIMPWIEPRYTCGTPVGAEKCGEERRGPSKPLHPNAVERRAGRRKAERRRGRESKRDNHGVDQKKLTSWAFEMHTGWCQRKMDRRGSRDAEPEVLSAEELERFLVKAESGQMFTLPAETYPRLARAIRAKDEEIEALSEYHRCACEFEHDYHAPKTDPEVECLYHKVIRECAKQAEADLAQANAALRMVVGAIEKVFLRDGELANVRKVLNSLPESTQAEIDRVKWLESDASQLRKFLAGETVEISNNGVTFTMYPGAIIATMKELEAEIERLRIENEGPSYGG